MLISPGNEGLEEAVHDSQAIREFVGIDLAREQVPNATTMLKFRRPLVERKKAQIRALVEHSLQVINNLFGYKKVSYRGLRKYGMRRYARFAPPKRALLDEVHQGTGVSLVRKSPRATLNFALNRTRRLKSHPILLHWPNPNAAGYQQLLDDALFSTSLGNIKTSLSGTHHAFGFRK